MVAVEDATASGGSGSYEYQFLVKDPSGTLAVSQAYSTLQTFAWSPPSAGTWIVVVWAKNVGSPAVLETDTGLRFEITPL